MVLTRIVRLSFIPSEIDAFIVIFEEVKFKIMAFEGNLSLKLMKDVNHPNVFYTVSTWDTDQALEDYRISPLFIETWAKTKKLFNDKPLAFSMYEIKK